MSKPLDKLSTKSMATILKIMLIMVCIAVLLLPTKVQAQTVTPSDTQKIEYKAVECKDNNGTKQLIIEVWIHGINFKGMDLRLQYDSNFLKPSNIGTNQIIDVNEEMGIPSCFEFNNEFGNYLDLFAMENTDGEFRSVLSILGEDERTGDNKYLIEDPDMGAYVQIVDSALMGRLSFSVLTDEEITKDALKLKEASTSPKTGIKVNINGKDSYEDPKIFDFTLNLASDNAYLSNLTLDKAEIENFNKEVFDYNVVLEEDTDKILVTPTKEDENATIMIKGNQIESGTPYEIELNPIGEETEIQILVTAEDEKTQKTYTVTIRRERWNHKRKC